jgi:hypothetical protein
MPLTSPTTVTSVTTHKFNLKEVKELLLSQIPTPKMNERVSFEFNIL